MPIQTKRETLSFRRLMGYIPGMELRKLALVQVSSTAVSVLPLDGFYLTCADYSSLQATDHTGL